MVWRGNQQGQVHTQPLHEGRKKSKIIKHVSTIHRNIQKTQWQGMIESNVITTSAEFVSLKSEILAGNFLLFSNKMSRQQISNGNKKAQIGYQDSLHISNWACAQPAHLGLRFGDQLLTLVYCFLKFSPKSSKGKESHFEMWRVLLKKHFRTTFSGNYTISFFLSQEKLPQQQQYGSGL